MAAEAFRAASEIENLALDFHPDGGEERPTMQGFSCGELKGLGRTKWMVGQSSVVGHAAESDGYTGLRSGESLVRTSETKDASQTLPHIQSLCWGY